MVCASARRVLGDRLGHWAQIFGFSHQVLAYRHYGDRNCPELLAARSVSEIRPFGTAYAVWTGIGAAGGVIIGIVAFGESADLLRVTCVIFIIAGTLGLRFVSGH
jgi:Small Multidrug Resistance protein